MKSLQLFFLALLLGLFIGCEPDPCEFVECGPGVCFEGICDCPDGFSGDNCEIEECFGVGCINGDCDSQTETCNCNPNYYGESCNILCVNGEFANGDCNCSEGYEGITCETESRCRFLGWWNCDQWTYSSQIGGPPIPGFTPASIKFEQGFNIFEVELFPTERSNGLMLLSSDTRIVGQVTENTINFEFQYLTTERTVYGSASLGDDDRILSIELYLFNPATSFTEVARGTFRISRYWKD
ncbi:MAG: hypothetical protein AAF502_19105 [Bacteroidota bacterium]